MKEEPLISINEARKLLGKEAQDLSDQEVVDLIVLLTDSAKEYLKIIVLKRQETD
jgi:hypothetical protein